MNKEAAELRQRDIFENYGVPKAVMTMAVPTVISQLVTLVYNMADTWFIGLTNDPYMVAGCSIVLPLFMMSIIISNLFGTGGGTLISRLLGLHENEEAKRVSALSLWMSLAATVVYCLTCLFAMDPILRFLGASDNVIPYARQYVLFVVVIGSIPTILSFCMSTIIRSIGNSKAASIGLTMGGLINIALDPLFMFVILKPGQQVMGAAIATCLSNCFAFVYYVIVFRKHAKAGLIAVDLRAGLPRRDSVRRIFEVGVPAALAALLFDLLNITINKLASGHGDIALAAIGIVLKIERLPLNIGIGISIGVIPLVAYNYSAGNYRRMNEVFSFARLCGLAVAGACVILYRTFAPQIMELFIKEPLTVQYGTSYLMARCFATPFMFLCFSIVHFCQAIGKGGASLAMAVFRQLVFNIPLLIILDRLYGMEGLVWTQLIADICTVIVSYIIYFRIRKKEGF